MAEFTVESIDHADWLNVRVGVKGVKDLRGRHGPFIPDCMTLRYESGLLMVATVSGPFRTPLPDPWDPRNPDFLRGVIFYRRDKGEPIPEALHQGISKAQMEDPDLVAYLKRWGT